MLQLLNTLKTVSLIALIFTCFSSLSKSLTKFLYVVLPFLIFFSMFFDFTLTIILVTILIILITKHLQKVKTTEISQKKHTSETFSSPRQSQSQSQSSKKTAESIATYDVNDIFDDPVKKHIQSVEKNLVQAQTNIFDPINYNLFFNTLKKEQYNTQGFSSNEDNLPGFDKTQILS